MPPYQIPSRHFQSTQFTGVALAPGSKAGELSASGASLLGLEPGTAVASAIIDAHSGVPGAGVGEAGTMVITMGTSGC